MATKKSSNNFLVQGGLLAFASIFVRFIGLLYRIPLNNIIGDEGMGYYSSAYLIYNIALLISSYSLPLAVSKLVASRIITKQYKNSFRIFVAALVAGAIVGLVASLIVFFGADFFAINVLQSPRTAIPLRVLSPTIFVFSIMGVFRGFFQGNNSMIQTSISQIIEQIFNAIVTLIASYYLMRQFSLSIDSAAYGAAGATLGTLLGAVAALGFLVFVFFLNWNYIKRKVNNDPTTYVDTYSAIMKMLAITVVPVILSQTVYQLSGVLDTSIFQHVMTNLGYSEAERNSLLGIYSNKFNLLTKLPVSVATAMATAIVPSIVTSKTNGMMMEVKKKINLGVKSNMMIAFPSAVGLSVLASPILQLLFGDSRELPAKMFQVGSIAIVFFTYSTITNGVLQGLDKMHRPVIHSTIALVIHTIILYVLLEYAKIGIFALVLGNIIFPLIVCVINWIYIKRLLDYNQEIRKTFVIPLISSIIMGVIAWLVYKGMYIVTSMNSISTIISLFAAIIVYFAFLLLLKGVTEDELYQIPKGTLLIKVAKKLRLL
ncbi:MAG: polysaccharide biosynthesis protein [Clostridiales bacterium]|mgnify:CR=1 FL=1|nr:polysaccharide biosynthesis protein [Clostridiales bacterium]